MADAAATSVVAPGKRIPLSPTATASGVPTKDASLVQTVRRLRGPVETDIVLTIQREAEHEVLTPTITREVIVLRSVTFQRAGERFGYIRISQFNQDTGADVREALNSLLHDGELSGLVLDLRNNPGGLFSQAVKLADVFLDHGLVVQTKGRVPSENRVFHARQATDWGRIPMVILVNRGTAAGSEILAAALQARKRAILVGAHTFGQGTIQTIIPIGDQAALRLTTPRAYSPTGLSLDAGLQPDVVVDADREIGPPSVDDPEVSAALRLLQNPISSYGGPLWLDDAPDLNI